jgi:hypothetical protein
MAFLLMTDSTEMGSFMGSVQGAVLCFQQLNGFASSDAATLHHVTTGQEALPAAYWWDGISKKASSF